ncbi:hypothetical protein Pelo_6424 [Pelomyxa schiedti]|nr:hypothetical protein Pelo_6424 [Pelomyxa schiedti]
MSLSSAAATAGPVPAPTGGHTHAAGGSPAAAPGCLVVVVPAGPAPSRPALPGSSAIWMHMMRATTTTRRRHAPSHFLSQPPPPPPRELFAVLIINMVFMPLLFLGCKVHFVLRAPHVIPSNAAVLSSVTSKQSIPVPENSCFALHKPEGQTCEDSVCGFDGITYNCADEAHSAGTGVLHCGTCGACSNYHDIWIYNVTRNNLTETSTKCAALIFLGEDAVTRCFNEHVGFTDACTECWVENVVCDNENCLIPCIECEIEHCPHNYPNGSLNKCLQCDEDICGPGFISCAGANRRDSCIVSDIERDDDEICTLCDTWPDGWSEVTEEQEQDDPAVMGINIGFTEECTACWVENVVCDNENCLGPCLECELKDCPSTYPNGSLNTCLQCDEDKCGPGFMSCAGANRRGSCIVSDIERYTALHYPAKSEF